MFSMFQTKKFVARYAIDSFQKVMSSKNMSRMSIPNFSIELSVFRAISVPMGVITKCEMVVVTWGVALKIKENPVR